MRVADLGEFGLIELLTRELGIAYPPAPGTPPRKGLLVDLGDDAVVTARRDAATIWTTDTMVDGVHFYAERTSWHDIGWKIMAVNLSDIAAMGGTPDLALVTLCLPPEFLVDDAISLYQGIREAATKFDVTLGGGDIVRSPVFSVTVALSGIAETPASGETHAMRRANAHVGDVIAVSGSVGDSAGGLRLLQNEVVSNNTGAARHLRLAHVRPNPRLDLGKAAIRAGVRCAIDVSDGLLQDLGHVSRASGVAVRIDANRVPVSAGLREVFPAQALDIALTGGEDYELVLIGGRTVIESLIDTCEIALTEIGEVVSGPARVAVIDEGGREIPMGDVGWDHFRQS